MNAASGSRARSLSRRLLRVPVIGPALQWMGSIAALPSLIRSLNDMRARLDAIAAPSLGETMEVMGSPLVAVAKERCGIAPETSVASLPAHTRYALFESIFYESAAVLAKQRVYLPYIQQTPPSRFPFLDLGCGRGEFLRILRTAGVEAIGVDINPAQFGELREQGFRVVEQNLLAFLEEDRQTYAGASLLQVVEHLTAAEIERAFAFLYARLAPGAILIVETPNTLSPFAMGVFNTDATHITPLPPERLRYAVEAAGFVETRTLFQARIPRDQFSGPDPRAYYADYAIIGYRRST